MKSSSYEIIVLCIQQKRDKDMLYIQKTIDLV